MKSIDEKFAEFICNYQQAAAEYDVKSGEKLGRLHKLFEGKRIYSPLFQNEGFTSQEARAEMRIAFGIFRQN